MNDEATPKNREILIFYEHKEEKRRNICISIGEHGAMFYAVSLH